MIIVVMAINMVFISISIAQDAVFEYKKNKAKKVWDDFKKLRGKMANFLAHEKAKEVNKLNMKFIKRERA
jgi:hypothetical protein